MTLPGRMVGVAENSSTQKRMEIWIEISLRSRIKSSEHFMFPAARYTNGSRGERAYIAFLGEIAHPHNPPG